MDIENGSLSEQMRKVLELTEENNRMLKAARRDKWIGFFLNILVWGVILAVSYYFTMQLIQPLLSSFSVTGSEVDINALMQQYQELLKQ